jgi:peptidyl-tRNA hydrolase, PTH1 family
MDAPLVIAGLGNPGQGYVGTRHNIGFWLVEAVARLHGGQWSRRREFEAEVCPVERKGRKIHLVKPQTYVNESGRSLGPFCRYYRVPETSLIVAYDELNLDVGSLKISVKGSAGGHNGLASLIEHVGSDFVRFRIGIGPRFPREMDLKDFVLGKFSGEQTSLLESRLSEFLDALHLLVDSGPNAAMNRINQRKKKDEPNEKLQSDLHSRHAGQEPVGGGSDLRPQEGPGSGER